jgi:hypothetical protein
MTAATARANAALRRLCRRLGRDPLELQWTESWGPGLLERRADGTLAPRRLTGP